MLLGTVTNASESGVTPGGGSNFWAVFETSVHIQSEGIWMAPDL